MWGQYQLIFIPLISFFISLMVFPSLIKILIKWQLFDATAEHKIHSVSTPSMGGIAVFIGFIVSLVIGVPLIELVKYKFFFVAVGVMTLVGLRDDTLTLRPYQKLIGQLLPIVILVALDQVILFSLNGFLGIHEIPKGISVLLTITVFVLITNSYNLIDGIDGLAGSIGLIALSCFGIWFILVGEVVLGLISFSLAGSMVAFLVFNWQPSKIFLGDTGSLVVGITLSYFALKFFAINASLLADNTAKFTSSIAAITAVLIIPTFDTTRIILIRLANGHSPFRADKNHLHHQFLTLGFSHSKAVVSLIIINLFFIGLALLMKNQGNALPLFLTIILCLSINSTIRFAQRRAKKTTSA